MEMSEKRFALALDSVLETPKKDKNENKKNERKKEKKAIKKKR